jgi:hypothetical protein
VRGATRRTGNARRSRVRTVGSVVSGERETV